MSDEKSMKGNDVKSSKLTATQVILIAGFVILIAAVAIAGYFIYTSMQQKPAENEGNSYVIDESNLAEITSVIEERVQDSMFEVNMNTVWNFPDGETASSNARIANSSSNKYPFAFDITLESEDTPIYTSTIIPVGSQLNKLELETALSAGTYNAVCTYHMLDEDGNEKSSLAVNVTLNIQN